MHDVAIVGAGPGGSAAGHFLARRGLRVVVLDRAEFPRDKTCGDGLTPRALRALDAMGILGQVARHGYPIDGYRVVAPNGRTTTAAITGQPAAMVVPRRTLDDMVLRRAVQSGAEFRGGTTVSHVVPSSTGVTVVTDSGVVQARHAIIATGAAGAVLTRSGILRRQPRAIVAARAYFQDVPDLGHKFQLHLDGVPLPGYGWLFPVASGVANVGVGFRPRKRGRTARAVFEAWTAHQPVLRQARRLEPVRGYPIRVDFLCSPTHAERTLLVGEAAGLVNPLTGEGIDYALESAQIAADHLEDGPAYHRALHARFARIFRFSEQVQDWYCTPLLLNVLVPLANRRPELRQLLASIVLGEREPAGFGPLTMLGRLLLYLVRTRPSRIERQRP
ncbi:MAG: geranylgeranyl reductase family protein [Chloroflexota bacterium]|nr:geranylgeranyl reductase family protein [Chloroflexota bacterium]